MPEPLVQVWSSVQVASGALTLSFIVAIALGIAALAVLYLASAVVVLERFARVARSTIAIVAFGALASAIAAMAMPGEGDAIGRVPLALAVVLAAVGVTAFALRALSPDRLGSIALSSLGVATAAFAGASGNPTAAAVPAGALTAVALGLAGWRRFSVNGVGSPPGPSASERRVQLLAVFLWLGVPLAGAGDGLRAPLASLGTGLFQLAGVVVLLGLLPLAAAGLVGMVRSVEWFIAVRYLVAKRRQVFISTISAICVGGIAAGVWLIIVVLSVMNGFERTWRDEILGNRAHLTVQSGDGPFGDYHRLASVVRGVPGVAGASPYLDADGLVRSDTGDVYTVRVRGIDPETVGSVTDLREDLMLGSIDAISDYAQPLDGRADLDPGIVLGNQLALALGAGIGDPVLLISPFGGTPTPLGPSPRLMRFRVVGIFQSSFFQYDQVYAYVSLPSVQRFRSARNQQDVVDGIEVRADDFYRSQVVGDAIVSVLGGSFSTKDWKEFFPAFFQALKTERVMMFVLLTMIMVVAAFLIVATLVMMIMEKSSDIAILKAMGAEDAAIERIFAIEGTLIGLVGTALGVVAGVAVTNQLTWIQETVEALTGVDALPSSVYQFSTLPSEMNPAQIFVVVAVALVLSLGATLLPSQQGARLDPAEGLRYE